MREQTVKVQRRERRKQGIRKKVSGTAQQPRMTVFRSLQHIYAQIIDDVSGVTLCEASTMSKDLKGEIKYGGNAAAAKRVGQLLAERAKQKNIAGVSFDRNGYRYHGRIKALADAAREGGLKF
jgi:large subunit ribosomal protein L18